MLPSTSINKAFILIWPLIDFCADFCLLNRPFSANHSKLLVWPILPFHPYAPSHNAIIELMVRIFMRIIGPYTSWDPPWGAVIDFWALWAGKTVQWTQQHAFNWPIPTTPLMLLLIRYSVNQIVRYCQCCGLFFLFPSPLFHLLFICCGYCKLR